MNFLRNTRHTKGDRGAVYVFVAMIMVVLILAAGLVIDLGQQRVARRDAQADADVIALDMARLADGASLTSIQTIPFDENGLAVDHLRASATRNHIPFTEPQKGHGVNTGGIELWDGSKLRLVVQWGWFSEQNEDSDCGSADEQVQVENGWWAPCTGGNKDIPNAAMVTVYDDVDFMLLPVGGGPSGGSVTRSAIARHEEFDLEQAWTRLGSRLASLNPASNTVLGSLFNQITNGQLGVLGYDGLANTHVDLDVFLEILDEEFVLDNDIPLTAMSPEQLATTHVQANDIMLAAVEALERQDPEGNAAAIEVINGIIAADVQDAEVNLADAIGADLSNDDADAPAGSAFVDIPSLLVTTASLMTGDHAVDIPAADIGIPGIAGVRVTLQLIESSRLFGHANGASGVTKQLNVRIEPLLEIDTTTFTQDVCDLPSETQNIIASLLGGLINLLSCLLSTIPQPIGAYIVGTMPIDINVAKITGIQHIDCPAQVLTVETIHDPVTATARFDLELYATVTDSNGNPLRIGPVFDAQIGDEAAPVSATLSGSQHHFTPFAVDPLKAQALQHGTRWDGFVPASAQVGTGSVALGNAIQIPSASISLINGAVNMGVATNLLLDLLRPGLSATLNLLDQQLIQPLLDMLGFQLGSAHIWPQTMTCLQDSSTVQLVG